MILNRIQSGVVVESRTLPPEPTVIAGVQQFVISLPREWVPVGLVEWDLQYSKSYDNSTFGDWIDLGTFNAITGLGDDPRTVDYESGTGGTYNHQIDEVSFPRPYYRYRYRLRTQFQQSDWSEEAYGGPGTSLPNLPAPAPSVVNPSSITNNEMGPNSVGSNQIITNAIIARTINSDEITTRHIAVGAIDASKAIIANATITLANINTATITNLASLSADLGIISAGTITGATIRTDVSPNKRVELTSTGLRGYTDATNKVFEIDTTTGIATFGGVVTTGASVPASTLTGFVGGGNLLKDSSAESTDPALPAGLWSANGGLITKQTTQAFHGSKSFRLVYSSSPGQVYSNVVGQHGIPIAALKSRPVVYSAWVYVVGTDNSTPATNKSIQIEDDFGVLASATIGTIPKNTWTRVVIKATPAATASNVYISLFNPYTSGLNTVYYDGLQLEMGDAATAYSPKADEIIYGSITSLEIAAATIKASNIEAGAINASLISVGMPSTVAIVNGQFNAGNPTDGTTLANGWSTVAGGLATATVQTSAIMGRVAQIVHGSVGTTSVEQTTLVNFPVGRNIIRCWIKTTSIAGGTGARIALPAGGTATATLTNSSAVTGTTDWTLVEAVADVTVPGTLNVRFQINSSSGTAQFANMHIVPSVTGTLITPNSITTSHLLATAIDAMTITGATFQTAAPGVARTVLDITGLRFIDSTLATTVDLSATAGGLTMLATALDTSPDSRKLRMLHTAGGATAGELYAFSNNTTTPTLSNGTFDTDTSGWTLEQNTGTIARDTAVKQAGAGSLKFVISIQSNIDHAYTTLTGTFKAGAVYRLPFYVQGPAAAITNQNAYIKLWTSTARTTLIQQQFVNTVAGSFTKNIIEIRPTSDITNPVLEINHASIDTVYYDSFGPVELPSATFITSVAKTGGSDIGQVLASVTDASSIKSNVLILNTEGQSDFLRLASTSKRKADFGVSSVTFSGPSQTSNNTVVSHNLGVSPTSIVAMQDSSSADNVNMIMKVMAYSSSTITFGARDPATARAATQGFFWMAIG